jgi:chemotaxis protein MotA
MGALAPAFGMIGTLIGLINMLMALDDPAALGPNMSVALITTFYGSVLANLLFIPMAGKLKQRSGQELLYKGIMLEGLLSIQAGENPRIIEEKLKAFLSPAERKREKEKNTDGGE